MLAKGLDLPLVTLVGIVLADAGLNLPDPFAGERAFQTLTQVAGRAGRSSAGWAGGAPDIRTGEPDHPGSGRAGLRDLLPAGAGGATRTGLPTLHPPGAAGIPPHGPGRRRAGRPANGRPASGAHRGGGSQSRRSSSGPCRASSAGSATSIAGRWCCAAPSRQASSARCAGWMAGASKPSPLVCYNFCCAILLFSAPSPARHLEPARPGPGGGPTVAARSPLSRQPGSRRTRGDRAAHVSRSSWARSSLWEWGCSSFWAAQPFSNPVISSWWV